MELICSSIVCGEHACAPQNMKRSSVQTKAIGASVDIVADNSCCATRAPSDLLVILRTVLVSLRASEPPRPGATARRRPQCAAAARRLPHANAACQMH